MTLNARNLTTHLVIHPVINIRRDSKGRIIDILKQDNHPDDAQEEAIIHVEVDRQTEEDVLEAIMLQAPYFHSACCLVIQNTSVVQKKLYRLHLYNYSNHPYCIVPC